MNTARPVLMFRLWYHGGIGAVRIGLVLLSRACAIGHANCDLSC